MGRALRFVAIRWRKGRAASSRFRAFQPIRMRSDSLGAPFELLGLPGGGGVPGRGSLSSGCDLIGGANPVLSHAALHSVLRSDATREGEGGMAGLWRGCHGRVDRHGRACELRMWNRGQGASERGRFGHAYSFSEALFSMALGITARSLRYRVHVSVWARQCVHVRVLAKMQLVFESAGPLPPCLPRRRGLASRDRWG